MIMRGDDTAADGSTPSGRQPTDGAVIAYIGIGANLGEARSTVLQAAKEIAELSGIQATRLSPLYRSAPLDAGGPDYVNAVLCVETTLAAEELLRSLLSIEQRHGRERPYRNAPRSLDLDLLLHGQERRASAFLTLPHPRMHERAFVLMPLADLEPSLELAQGSVATLLAACSDQRLERL